MALKIYTKTGDKGSTGLFGGQRVPKHDVRIEAYGTVDELNSVLGIVLTHDCPPRMREHLLELSALLFTVGSDLATPLDPTPMYEIPRVLDHHIEWLESLIDSYDAELEPLKSFILPGGTPAAAQLHLARTVCRRAERVVVALGEREDIGATVLRFLNRCSDYLFTAARYANHTSGISDIPWTPHR